jgi:hypothetical protein
MAVIVPAAAAVLLAADIAETVLVQIVGQLVASVIGGALAPELLELQQESFKLTNTRALDPASSIEAFIRGHRSEAQSKDDVGAAGYSGELWQALADSAGEPIPLEMAMEAWRRGLIPLASPDPNAVSLTKAIKDSRLKNVWTETVTKLQFAIAPVGTIVEGWLRAQVTPQEAYDLLYKQGVDKPTGDLMFKAAGRPPSPQELFTLWNRGIIPEQGRGGDTLSVEQGYLETDLKDKWLPIWKHLREYRPPPRTITALSRAGAITDEQALKLYKEEGLTDEMAAIYVKTAHHERAATTRELTKAELVSLYVDQAIDATELGRRLLARGYLQADVDSEIELADLKVSHALEQRAVNRVGTLYTGRKIDKQTALTTLDSLGLPAPQRDRLLKIWDLERGDNLKHLTPPQLGHAVLNGWYSVEQALAVLGAQGYGARDAWVLLSIELKQPASDAMPTDNLPPL